MTHPPCHPNGRTTVHSKAPLRHRCSTCKRTYSSRMGTHCYGSKLDAKTIHEIQQELEKGLSIRQIARKLELSPSTVFRWKNTFDTY